MIRLYVALHGAGYSHPEHADEYDSLEQAAREYESRRFQSYYPCWGDPSYADATNDGRWHAGMAWYVDDEHPAVSLNPEDHTGRRMLDTCDMYPDRELTVGPRGGLRWERC